VVIGTGNFDDEAEIGFDHEFAGLGFAPTNSATNFSLVGLVEERSFADALQVGLEGSGKFAGARKGLGSGAFLVDVFHTSFDR
jgi:hypothetical protein